ncbi:MULTISPECIES: N(5)-(carboxyethyl)ornithine synthase [Actinoalloteichus]|uniref:Alanine dehydrogenase n=1 Tax=Actinoalloteichus fjordicus TaxID=1612552 RepID=A0AAC9LGX7_9PSEU|nr:MULTISPECIES: N(5)-(carboxyethyl)ornithine synthase [Actinoalloteichus]APU16109.1 alanine dehydrogenase [Actinoalloteichus fjordicus]APU22174.1 alanine dehydrogenase [Actinoalloteichus sp. GBA129-24]
MSQLSLGVMSGSRKENERRLPIHPLHVDRIEAGLRDRIFLEQGYGSRFGVSDEQLAAHIGGVRPRDQLLAECDVILQIKPLPADFAELRRGQVLWGWPHCVQNEEITQLAVDGGLTLIAFEAMHHWQADGGFGLHVFHKNNELAGYCSVLHALEIIGSTGDYGRRLRAVVIGFGATARGAVTALNAHGVHDVDVLTNRGVTAVGSPIHSARIVHVEHDGDDPRGSQAATDGVRVPLADFLAEHDIIVNCVLQQTDSPLTFLVGEDLSAFAPGSLIVDVSCDEGMGFDFARPTSFTEPMFTVGDGIRYYGVDHSPSYLWNSATWEISDAVLPYLRTILAGPAAWEADETVRRAVEIRDGVIRNPGILSFQGRSPDYPHARS